MVYPLSFCLLQFFSSYAVGCYPVVVYRIELLELTSPLAHGREAVVRVRGAKRRRDEVLIRKGTVPDDDAFSLLITRSSLILILEGKKGAKGSEMET